MLSTLTIAPKTTLGQHTLSPSEPQAALLADADASGSPSKTSALSSQSSEIGQLERSFPWVVHHASHKYRKHNMALRRLPYKLAANPTRLKGGKCACHPPAKLFDF